MSAEEVRRRSFSSAFRGFDQGEVREFLDRLAEELEDSDRREKELRSELREARDRLLHPRLDEDTLTSALGQEAAQILRSAHDAAGDVRRKSEEHAARVLAEAHREAEGIHTAAEMVMGERTAEAEAAADAIRAAAETEAASVLARARQHAEAALVEARNRCDALAQEAETLKGRVLGDLVRRRRVMNAQVEQLGAGRESILRALHEVRRLLDQTVDSLDRISTDAKAAADEARTRALSDQESDAADIERDAGEALASPLEGLTNVLAGLEQSLASLAAGESPPVPVAPEPVSPAPGSSVITPPAASTWLVTSGSRAASSGAVKPPEAAEASPSIEPSEPSEVSEASEASEESDGEELTELERRGSLRLLRRGKHRPPAGSPASYAEEPGEGVRLIRTAPSSPPEPEAAPEPALSSAESSVEAPPDEHAEGRHGSVDELFARLRAERAAARDEAQAVLAEGGPSAPRETAADQGHDTASDAGRNGSAAAAIAPVPGAADTGGDEGGGAGPSPPDQAGSAERGGAGAEGAGPESGSEGAGSAGAVATDDSPDGDEQEGPLLEMRNRMLGSVSERLARRLKRALQDDQNEVLDRVRGAGRGRPGSVLPEEATHRGAYAAAAGPLVEEAFRAGGMFAAEVFPGAAPGGTGPNREVADALATEIVVQLRARLTALFDGPDGEEADLAEGASAAYRSWKGERVESLAMDYVVDSFTAGVLAAVPEGAKLRWVVDDDGGPCPDCDDNALAGPTTAGDSFPTGQQHPPAHPGCRCLLAPALT